MSPKPAVAEYLPPGPQNLRRGQLKPSAENPKATIDREKLEALKGSIKDDPGMMLDRPIGVADGPQHHLAGYVWGGHQRIIALDELYAEGWESPLWPKGTYPCTVQDLPLKMAEERLARDNVQFADWDPGKAVNLLKRLESQGTNITHVGFDPATMAKLTAQAEEAAALLTSSTAPPPPQAPSTAAAEPQELTSAPPPPPPPPPTEEDTRSDPAGTGFLDRHEEAGNPDLRFPQEAQAPQLGDDLHDFTLRVTVTQRDTIMRAVRDMRRRNPNFTTADAMEAICADWLAMPEEDDADGDNPDADGPEAADAVTEDAADAV